MGVECSVAQMQSKLCGGGEQINLEENNNIDANNNNNNFEDNINIDANNESQGESDVDLKENTIVGIDDPNQNTPTTDTVLNNYPTSSGLYSVNLSDLDVSDLEKKLKPSLMSINIVQDNVLKLTFRSIGFSIDESKCERSRTNKEEVTLMVVDHSQSYGSFEHSKGQSLSAFYTVPKGVRILKCNPL